jgi:hypothetical protein
MSEKQLRLYRETPPTTTGPIALRLRLVAPNAASRPATPAPEPVPAVASVPVAASLTLDDQIFAILDAPAEPGVTVSAAYREKEQTLAEFFKSLSVADARALHRRFTIPSTGDALAERFSRLVIDRKTRLIAVLAGARRREALCSTRRV